MKYINLRELYPDVYKTDTLVEVTEEELDVIQAADRAEAAYKRRMYRYKAQYSLDCNNGIEKVVMVQPPTPEEILEDKQLRDQLYAAVMALPDKQAKRIYAHFYLGMTPKEIAQAEGVDPGRQVRKYPCPLASFFLLLHDCKGIYRNIQQANFSTTYQSLTFWFRYSAGAIFKTSRNAVANLL